MLDKYRLVDFTDEAQQGPAGEVYGRDVNVSLSEAKSRFSHDFPLNVPSPVISHSQETSQYC